LDAGADSELVKSTPHAGQTRPILVSRPGRSTDRKGLPKHEAGYALRT
jgi:hypothetical protein